eukprot:452140-Prymnesium_polylepis.1
MRAIVALLHVIVFVCVSRVGCPCLSRAEGVAERGTGAQGVHCYRMERGPCRFDVRQLQHDATLSSRSRQGRTEIVRESAVA